MKMLAIVVALFLAGAGPAAQNDPLKAARDLYASAAYEEALSELARVERDTPASGAVLETDAYRAFCLIALGRQDEAETLLESLVRKDPMLTVDRYPDVSPRIADQFAGVRKRLLPQLIREEYRIARARAVEKMPDAGARLARVRDMLGAARDINAWDDTLDDLRLLVDGFLDLSRGSPSLAASLAAEPPAAPPAAEPREAAALSPAARAVFDAGSEGVVPPFPLSQSPPVMPRRLIDQAKKQNRTAVIQVFIDERGDVESVIVRQPVTDAYDARVVAAARSWKYRPATKDGVPVKYVRTMVVAPHEQ